MSRPPPSKQRSQRARLTLRPGQPLDQRSLPRMSRAQSRQRWQHEVCKLEPRRHGARAQREPPPSRLGRLQDAGGDHRQWLFARSQIGTERDSARPALVEQVEQERVTASSAPSTWWNAENSPAGSRNQIAVEALRVPRGVESVIVERKNSW